MHVIGVCFTVAVSICLRCLQNNERVVHWGGGRGGGRYCPTAKEFTTWEHSLTSDRKWRFDVVSWGQCVAVWWRWCAKSTTAFTDDKSSLVRPRPQWQWHSMSVLLWTHSTLRPGEPSVGQYTGAVVCTCICMCICYNGVKIRILLLQLWLNTHTHTHTHIHTRTHAYTHAHTHTHIHARTHMHTQYIWRFNS